MTRATRAAPALALLAAALALAGPAAAHGASITMSKDAGRYHVVFYTFSAMTEGEVIRFSWNVTDAASGQRVRVVDPALTATFIVDGKVANSSSTALEQTVPGILYADVQMGPSGLATFTVGLDNGTQAEFEQTIYPASALGNAPAKTPVPAVLALGGLAMAAALPARRLR